MSKEQKSNREQKKKAAKKLKKEAGDALINNLV